MEIFKEYKKNTGKDNSGDYNSGDYNSGRYNSGYYSIGIFNTNEPKMRAFNKYCDITYTQFREKYGFNDLILTTTKWIKEADMTSEEKDKHHPEYKTICGYLRKLEHKDAWKEAWSKANEEQKNWYKSLPNFDARIFEEITGIKIDCECKEELKKDDIIEVCKDGKKFKAKIL